MESEFRIYQFDKLDDNTQQDIQDFISGVTHKWAIEIYNYCNMCSCEAELHRMEWKEGVVRLCKPCFDKMGKISSSSEDLE